MCKYKEVPSIRCLINAYVAFLTHKCVLVVVSVPLFLLFVNFALVNYGLYSGA